MSYKNSLDEKDGAWKSDAKIAAGVDSLDNTHPLNCTTDGTLEVQIAGTDVPLDVLVNNVVPVSQSGTWTVNLATEPTIDIGKVDQGTPGTSPWPVTISGGTISVTPFFVNPLASNSVTGVPALTLTTIVTYTAATDMHLSRISVSGNIYAKFQLFLNTVLIETKRSGPDRSLDFDFNSPLILSTSSILDVKAIHYDTSASGDFESTVYGG